MFINMYQSWYKFTSETSSSQNMSFSDPNFMLIESATFQLPMVHTWTMSLSLTPPFQCLYQPNMLFLIATLFQVRIIHTQRLCPLNCPISDNTAHSRQ